MCWINRVILSEAKNPEFQGSCFALFLGEVKILVDFFYIWWYTVQEILAPHKLLKRWHKIYFRRYSEMPDEKKAE